MEERSKIIIKYKNKNNHVIFNACKAAKIGTVSVHFISNISRITLVNRIDVEYIYGLVWSAGLQTKSMTSQRYRAAHKMADMRYYGNVMTTTRWRLYVTMETLRQQQDGGYALLWKRFLHLQQYSHRLNFNFLFLFHHISTDKVKAHQHR